MLAPFLIILSGCSGPGFGHLLGINNNPADDSGPGPAPVVLKDCGVRAPAYAAKLLQVQQRAGIRVFYTSTPGDPDATPLADADTDGVPDYVENVLRQAVHVRAAYNSVGFRDPLDSPRYKSFKGVNYIDIHIRNLGANGLAYDEAVSYSNNPLMLNTCAIQIDISNSLAVFPGTWSIVGHEMFHLYQYGYMMFKRPWLLEGMAAYAERILRTGGVKGTGLVALPANASDLQALIYDVDYNTFWDRLAYIAEPDRAASFPLDASLAAGTYTDGTTPVFRDQLLWGYPFVIQVLENLEADSTKLSAEKGWDPSGWTETDQKDAQYNTRIMKSVWQAIRQKNLSADPTAGAEVTAFLALE